MSTQGIKSSVNQIVCSDLEIEAGCTEFILALFGHRLKWMTCRVGEIVVPNGSSASELQLSLMINHAK